MRIALAQLNPVVGDFEGNAKRILEAVRRAEEQAVELVLTPELSLWGTPPGTSCSSQAASNNRTRCCSGW